MKKSITGGGGGGGVGVPPMVSVTKAITSSPAAFLAVSLYVVVRVTVTPREPTKATGPMPLSIVTVLAPATVQRSVVDKSQTSGEKYS